MDPLYEQRLRDEVIFLHSLWHQGPPTLATATATVAAAASTSTSTTPYHLQSSKRTRFKKKKRSKKRIPNKATPDASMSPGAEWPCPATPPPTTAWPTYSAPTTDPLPLSPEEQSKLAAKRAHHRALKLVREFFSRKDCDGCDEIESTEDDEDSDEVMEEDCEGEQYSVLSKVFEDTELKEYYEKNFVMGEFSCLVCGAIGGKKASKKFKGCLPLVQHSISIEKTKRRTAHRVFAQAVCKVLGWDINRLHEIVAMMSDKSGNTQVNGNCANEESSAAFVHNVDSAKDATSDGEGDKAEPSSDDGKSLKEPASDGLTTSISACHDANKTEIEVHPTHTAAVASASAAVPMVSHHPQPSEAEWSFPSSSDWPSTNVWPTAIKRCDTQEKSSLNAILPSTKEQLLLAARHAHKHALEAINEFFRTNMSSDSDGVDSGSDDDDDDDDDDDEDTWSEKFSIFSKVFEEDPELREHYVKNFVEGEFSCLVCGAMGGKKTGKKFTGCLPLVQHSITIANTKNRKAHRAFGKAVCKVLGWDIDSLAGIASMLSDKTGGIQGSSNSDGNEGSVSLIQNDKRDPETVHIDSGISPSNDEGNTIPVKSADAMKNLENVGIAYQQDVVTPASHSQELAIGHNMGDPMTQ